ncbi:hypothetical protein TNCV_863851 [Trichonephila clavipes]|nr:hypothetical protein TNCV_863851 [Trichonephila clavipes]
MVSTETTGFLKGGKFRRMHFSDVVGEDLAALMIAQSSRVLVFLGLPDPPRRQTIPSMIHCCQHRATTISLRPRVPQDYWDKLSGEVRHITHKDPDLPRNTWSETSSFGVRYRCSQKYCRKQTCIYTAGHRKCNTKKDNR